jgi:transposase
MEHDSIIGLDIAKNVFQVHRTDGAGAVLECRRLRRGAVLAYFAQAPRSLVGLEACASAHHWGRALALLGHRVRLIAPSYVKPYVQRQKNDAADAAAIAEAVSRPHMRFVPLKSVPQQGVLMLHRVRALLIRQRTMAINALRAHLAELGIVSARGRSGVTALVALVESGHEENPLEELARAALSSLVAQLHGLQAEIAKLERAIMRWHRNNEASRRLATIPGIGYLTASALAATLGDGSAFGSARQLAAWLGLVPRQNSSGGKARLGRITKQGDPYLRRLLVTGATAALKGAKANAQTGRLGPYPWAEAMLANKPYRLVSVALANKMARIVWAVLSSGEAYRPRPAADAGLQAAAG